MENIIDQKWKKLLYRSRLFEYIPFIDIVFVAGSMAMGTATKDSDFDLIVGVRTGRIFIARAFCVLLFGLLGWRRKKGASEEEARDKFCFNHFVTPDKYCLSAPYNEYWQDLYAALVPVYGCGEDIRSFYSANSVWMKNKKNYQKDCERIYLGSGYTKIFLETILSGKIGNVVESLFKKIQITKIKKSLKSEKQYKPRIIFNDSELEFHPDTKRIEERLNR